MKITKTRFLIPLSIVIVLLLVVLVVALNRNSTSSYYLITLDNSIEDGAPVYVENVQAGTVGLKTHLDGNPEIMLVRLDLDAAFSIPSNSRIEVERDGTGITLIRIKVLASKGYFKPGDTLFMEGAQLATQGEDSIGRKSSGSSGDLVYRVQLLASTNKISENSATFHGISNVVVLQDGSVYKYYAGNEPTLEKAKLLKQRVIDNGIPDAFIVAFLNNRRISLDEAIKFEK
jgi:ABC-type transporter Mla subunit MlaD